MKLLYDLLSTQPVGSIKFHGGGEYGKSLFSGVVKNLEDSVELSVCYNPNIFLDDWLLDLINNSGCKVIPITSTEDIASLIESGTYDVFYSPIPYYLHRDGAQSATRLIGTVHGLRSIEMPTDRFEPRLTKGIKAKSMAFAKQLIPRDRLVSRAVSKYTKCINSLNKIYTDSLHSKSSIQYWLNPNANIDVRYSVPTITRSTESSDQHVLESVTKRFVLMISCDRWLKNPIRGVEALDALFSKGLLPGYEAVCVGAANSNVLAKVDNPDRFKALPYVSSATLQELYGRCDVFFYPTLNEGFGYPPIEAMRYGKTCAVSCTCSVPEICGDAALYFNPYDLNEMATRLVQAVESPKDPELVVARFDHIREKQERDMVSIVNDLIGA